MQLLFKKKYSFIANGSFNIDVWHRKVGGAEHVPMYEKSFFVDEIDKVEWSFNTEVYSGKQYFTITCTDYVLWLFPRIVCEYIYEVPADKYNIQDVTNDTIKNILRKLFDFEYYQIYTDELYKDTSYDAFGLIYNNDRWILKISDDDFHFIRTK